MSRSCNCNIFCLNVEGKNRHEVVSVAKHHTTKQPGGVEVNLHTFLNSALPAGEQSLPPTGHVTPGKEAHLYPLDRMLGWLLKQQISAQSLMKP
jgi:hypothetical protein